MKRFPRCFLPFLLLAFLSLLSGCGRKTPLLPPQDVVPQPIDDLRFSLDEKGVELRWSYPLRTMQGQRLEMIEEFEIYRAIMSPEKYCPDCPLSFGTPRRIAGGKIPPGVSVRTATFRDTLLRPGQLYFYKVRAKGGWYYSSPDSNIVSFLWQTPLAAPQDFAAVAGDNTVHLSWKPVHKLLDGTDYSGPISYQLFRKTKEKENFASYGPVLQDNRYTDISVMNNRDYLYTIRALRQEGSSYIAGEPSGAVLVRPRDLTPPPPPTDLTAHWTGDRVVLEWRMPKGEQVDGFFVYRRCDDGAREKIGTCDKTVTKFEDKPSHSSSCFYQVSAFDSHSNESPPTPEQQVQPFTRH